MSYIASFYLVDEADSEALASSAEIIPKSRRVLGIIPRTVVDTKEAFWETINSKAKELEGFQHSGFAFVDLLTMYPEIEANSHFTLGARLTQSMDSLCLSFTYSEALNAMAILGPRYPSREEIAEFMGEEGRNSEATQPEVAIQSAWESMIRWLSQVEDGYIGLVLVG
ncbi:MAG: hypothetical protein AAF702_33540 [Chloroflexota bacterium]